MGPKLNRNELERLEGELDPESLTGHFTLIVGDVNRAKTVLAGKILTAFCRALAGPFTVIDLAPSPSPRNRRLQVGGMPVGGALVVPDDCRIRYHHPRLAAPRLEGSDDREQEALARENRRKIEALFELVLQNRIENLFVNDCSLYLQAGPVDRLLGWIRCASTAVVNGYYGRALGPGSISERERAAMEQLMSQCDHLVEL